MISSSLTSCWKTYGVSAAEPHARQRLIPSLPRGQDFKRVLHEGGEQQLACLVKCSATAVTRSSLLALGATFCGIAARSGLTRQHLVIRFLEM